MKHWNKKITFILCVLSCALLMAGCNVSLTKQNKNFAKDVLKENADSAIEEWFGTDYTAQMDQYQEAIDYYDGMKDSFSDSDWESYQTQRAEWVEQIKEFKSNANLQQKYGKEKKKNIGKPEYTISSESATISVTVQTNKGKKLVFSVSYDTSGSQTEIRVEEYKTLGQKMGKAGLNTILSMAIVFVVLIFISLIISCFKVIGVVQDRKNQKMVASVQVAPVPITPSPEVAAESSEEDLMDDLELVAVITAAVAAASETECADGLVIRSIVRRS